VPEDLWHAAHERLRGQRARYLRHQDGRLWGRPTRDRESPYLLPGFAQCGVCGASLYVRSGTATRGIGRPKTRRYAYQCQVHSYRGGAVCTNASVLPRETNITLGSGEVPNLVKRMRALQRQRDALAEEFVQISAPATPLPRDLRAMLERRLADWQGAMSRNVAQARQLLRRLLVGRIVFTPTPAGVEFVGQVTLGNLLAGIACTNSVVSRPGLEPGSP
jgi:hypothetical protein